ncbi:NACHT domain-containing protein [Streptomyces sp. ASQP_92]|uniref:NACHT domain-containing protein n=1 Tax=Streptomyces sp. ASQP_92 TaxID=2979116 RepID=UPI0021C12139|nr:NACHT domain-containing protein [Streptomyces sp. ASQP_92]MCT9088386.1 NACHT domain-containing protein [Streptomyces sp. ASQP_92]
MPGLEVVVLRLACTVVSAVAKSVLTPRPGAGLVAGPLRPLPKQASPDRLAKVLGRRLDEAHDSLPEHERAAAVDAVRDGFAAAGALGLDRLFSLGLDADRLAAELRRPYPGPGEALYDELLTLCCAHVLEQLTAHPSFAARAALEQTRSAQAARGLIEDVRDRVGPRPEAAALAFEETYARYVAEIHGRLELFGLTLGRSASEWPLDTAYISLAVSGEPRQAVGLPHARAATMGVEQALAGNSRLLLRGPAGSGKSTLVQWLALNAARRTFGPELADWNRCVPFVLRLRAFTSAASLPMPQDFLQAAGVPLTPAPGWAGQLLSEGRALVLVDGVDEVPMRLRARTEAWLKSLVTAFPAARYVVTTRPSAVSEDWLAGQGFVAHSLLPMEREDVRAFVAHWHASARLACPAPEERERLDTYEASLLTAVASRRDLGRLATNPLMCALLCALNRDRRMQLPRARKELYDAALDMLLVRRDTEREITGVEGVTLTRDEQTALLQRLAYWLIRNGLAEADRDEVASMVTEWLGAMPQVTGDPDHVFAHLLIRSGLLREPMPGAVGFVHRTFQDYLGAKAAVEERDFGVLVRNAHDDTWDDVVRMAVGHARADERARLLRQLLRRADHAPRLRHRLVLLAAACLEHAPELDPAVWADVEERARELMPPRSWDEAEALAKVGPLVLELLPGPEGLTEDEAAFAVRTAGLIGGDAALGAIRRFRGEKRPRVRVQLGLAWGKFDAAEYVTEVLGPAQEWENTYLSVRTEEQVAQLSRLQGMRMINLEGDCALPDVVLTHPGLTALNLIANGVVEDLVPLLQLNALERLALHNCPAITDLTPVSGLPALRDLSLATLSPRLCLTPLAALDRLEALALGIPGETRRIADIPAPDWLLTLGLYRGSERISLSGLERWPDLRNLTITGGLQAGELVHRSTLRNLRTLQIGDHQTLDPAALIQHCGLTYLNLSNCRLVAGLGILRELPDLRSLSLYNCTGRLDLSTLAHLDRLHIRYSRTDVQGAESIPPERLERY